MGTEWGRHRITKGTEIWREGKTQSLGTRASQGRETIWEPVLKAWDTWEDEESPERCQAVLAQSSW